MPDIPRLPEPADYLPEKVGYLAQGFAPRLAPGALEENFSKSKNDLEKFSYMWQQGVVHEMIMLESEFSEKDQVKAAEYRKKGNTYFKKKSYLSAMESYNQCIIMAKQEVPETGDHELALAYNNRSAALYHLKKHEMSLRDTNLAIENHYPSDTLYKVYDRKGKLFFALKKKDEAIESFKKSKECLVQSCLNEEAVGKWEAELDRQIKVCEDIKEPEEKSYQDYNKASYLGSNVGRYSKTVINSYGDYNKLPKVARRPHETHQSASNSLEFKYNDSIGRHPVAQHDLTIGDALIVEKPFAAILLPEFYPDHCYNCQVRVVAPIPCSDCTSVVFCSTGCQKEAWEGYHKHECKFFVLFEQGWCGRIGHLAHRLIVTIGLEKLMEFITNPENHDDCSKENGGRSKEGMYKSDLKALLNLETNMKNKSPTEAVEFTIFSMFITKFLKTSGYLKSQSTLEIDFESERYMKIIGGIVLQLLQAIQCNSKGIKEALMPTDFETINPTDIGVGIYTTAALINHSCYPNTELIFYGDTLVMRATRVIYEGQEITTSYGPLFHANKKFYRLKCTTKVYGFICRCESCVEDWAQWRDVESQYPDFACENCHRSVDIAEMEELKYLTCSHCSHKADVTTGWGQLTVSHEEYAKAVDNAFHMKLDAALPRLAGHLALMQRYIRMPWKDILMCESAIQNCYKLFGNRKQQFSL